MKYQSVTLIFAVFLIWHGICNKNIGMESNTRFKVHNANYDKVSYFIEKLLSESEHYCGCLRCRMDTAALALNTLPPHYFVDPTNLTSSEIGSPWILIELAVKEALERVRENPHHTHPMAEEDAVAPRKYA